MGLRECEERLRVADPLSATPTSCNPKVQKNFERGVALLHSFAFETAEATFRQVAQDDPHCAMAHWG